MSRVGLALAALCLAILPQAGVADPPGWPPSCIGCGLRPIETNNLFMFQETGFVPADVTVKAAPDHRVILQNFDDVLHTVTDDRCDTGGPCAFDVEVRPDHNLAAARWITAWRTMTWGDVIPFHCRIHPDMKGTLTVT
jgi:hypothetical protein